MEQQQHQQHCINPHQAEDDHRMLTVLLGEMYNSKALDNARQSELEGALRDFKTSPQLHIRCIDLLILCGAHTGVDHSFVVHFSAACIEEVVLKHWTSLPTHERGHLGTFLLQWLLQNSPRFPSWVSKKVAKVIVDVAKLSWPKEDPGFMGRVVHLVESDEHKDAGIALLSMAVEEFTRPDLPLPTEHTKELRAGLLHALPNIVNLLIALVRAEWEAGHLVRVVQALTCLETLISASSVESSTTHAQSSQLFETLFHIAEGAAVGYQQLRQQQLDLDHLKTSTQQQGQQQGQVQEAERALARQTQSVDDRGQCGRLSVKCISSVVDKHWVPKELQAVVLNIANHMLKVLHLMADNGGAGVTAAASMSESSDDYFVEDLADFLSVFVAKVLGKLLHQEHTRAATSSTSGGKEQQQNWPVSEFLTLMATFTFCQPHLRLIRVCFLPWQTFAQLVTAHEEGHAANAVAASLAREHAAGLTHVCYAFLDKLLFLSNGAGSDGGAGGGVGLSELDEGEEGNDDPLPAAVDGEGLEDEEDCSGGGDGEGGGALSIDRSELGEFLAEGLDLLRLFARVPCIGKGLVEKASGLFMQVMQHLRQLMEKDDAAVGDTVPASAAAAAAGGGGGGGSVASRPAPEGLLAVVWDARTLCALMRLAGCAGPPHVLSVVNTLTGAVQAMLQAKLHWKYETCREMLYLEVCCLQALTALMPGIAAAAAVAQMGSAGGGGGGGGDGGGAGCDPTQQQAKDALASVLGVVKSALGCSGSPRLQLAGAQLLLSVPSMLPHDLVAGSEAMLSLLRGAHDIAQASQMAAHITAIFYRALGAFLLPPRLLRGGGLNRLDDLEARGAAYAELVKPLLQPLVDAAAAPPSLRSAEVVTKLTVGCTVVRGLCSTVADSPGKGKQVVSGAVGPFLDAALQLLTHSLQSAGDNVGVTKFLLMDLADALLRLLVSAVPILNKQTGAALASQTVNTLISLHTSGRLQGAMKDRVTSRQVTAAILDLLTTVMSSTGPAVASLVPHACRLALDSLAAATAPSSTGDDGPHIDDQPGSAGLGLGARTFGTGGGGGGGGGGGVWSGAALGGGRRGGSGGGAEAVAELVPPFCELATQLLVTQWKSFVETQFVDGGGSRVSFRSEAAQELFEGLVAVPCTCIATVAHCPPGVVLACIRVLQVVNDTHRLFSFGPFTTSTAPALLTAVLNALSLRSQRLLEEELSSLVFAVSQGGGCPSFVSHFLPQYLSSLGADGGRVLDEQSRGSLLAKWTGSVDDAPTFLRVLRAFCDDLYYYRVTVGEGGAS